MYCKWCGKLLKPGEYENNCPKIPEILKKHQGSLISCEQCFPAGTSIQTPTGAIDIASAKQGDIVLAFDASGNTLHNRRILKIRACGKNQIWELQFKDGKKLRTTGSHSIRLEGAWKQVRNIVKGESVCCFGVSGQIAIREVACSIPTADVQEVFNLIVEENFSFVADGVIAHSFAYFRKARMAWWTLICTLRDLTKSTASQSPRAGATFQ